MAKNDRFKIIYNQGILTCASVLVDAKTGVNYLLYRDGGSAALTVLLDRDGKPVVTPPEEQ